jgi:hypothetical protein
VTKRKPFHADIKPEYMAVTKWHPEQIDDISLKFRDMHIIYQIIFDYTQGFIKSIEEKHAREGHRLDFNAPPSLEERQNEDLVRIMFAAQLSVYETILYYLKERMGVEGNKWLAELRRTDKALNAFERLRNRDIHHEAMHTLIGMRFKIEQTEPPYSSIDTKEVHVHQHLLHQGAGFFPKALAETKQFEGQPGLVQFVTFEPIVLLAHTVTHRIADVLNEAVQRGYWNEVEQPFTCTICQNPAHTVAEST